MKLERAFYLHTAPEGLRREGCCLFGFFCFFLCRERKEEKGFVLDWGEKLCFVSF